ncbi:hypothetical protein GW17_00054050 [Ensete ventricosum]|nr:hypothetical protein GW17_00054050 [Ensete ventricosum]
MHPLRFPNSGIRAKVFVRKIGFKLRVMILNRVESFYAFLLRFRSEGNKEEGSQAWPRLAPLQGRPTTAKAPLQGGQPPASTSGCGQPARGCRPRRARKGRLPVARLQGGGGTEGGKERARASF